MVAAADDTAGRNVPNVRMQQLPNVFTDHIAFHVHGVVDGQAGERRVAQGVVDQRQLHHLRGGNRVHRQAHAVYGDGAVWHHQLADLPRHRDIDEHRIVESLNATNGSQPVHVPLHDVAAQPIRCPHGALEVHALPRTPTADGGAAQCRYDSGHRKTAIAAVADHAMERGTGARGLRAIIEEVLLHVMYDVPSRGDVAKVVVTKETVLDDVPPEIVLREDKPKKKSA